MGLPPALNLRPTSPCSAAGVGLSLLAASPRKGPHELKQAALSLSQDKKLWAYRAGKKIWSKIHVRFIAQKAILRLLKNRLCIFRGRHFAKV